MMRCNPFGISHEHDPATTSPMRYQKNARNSFDEFDIELGSLVYFEVRNEPA